MDPISDTTKGSQMAAFSSIGMFVNLKREDHHLEKSLQQQKF